MNGLGRTALCDRTRAVVAAHRIVLVGAIRQPASS
jgi:hypothetical protein